ncbi:hypothetical protein V8F06_003016 [Rhypophila decipiens]
MDDTAPNLSLQQSCNPASQDVSLLLNLPNEMIMEICRSLCLHCRHERIGELSAEDVAAGIQDQLAISRLSRCSKTLRDIAQPILFHFFACLEAQVTACKREAAFIHTLFWRPDLASSVRSLILWSPITHYEKTTFASALDDQAETSKRIAKRLGPQWEGRQYNNPFDFHELAIALAPRTNYILLHCNFGYFGLTTRSPSFTWENWPQRLENLKHLVFVDWHTFSPSLRDHSLGDLVAFIKHMPNLESLKLSILGFMRGSWGAYVSCSVIEVLVRHSPVLEDLEFFHPWEPMYMNGRVDMERFDLDGHLGTAKTTLKRLCYSAFGFGLDYNDMDVPSHVGRRSVIPIYGRGEDEENADEHGSRFPQLRSVTLDLNQRPPRKEHDILLQTYQTAGISLTTQYMVCTDRGLLPTRPAGYPAPKPTPISYEEETRV